MDDGGGSPVVGDGGWGYLPGLRAALAAGQVCREHVDVAVGVLNREILAPIRDHAIPPPHTDPPPDTS